MNDLPEDLAHPRRDFGDRASLIANVVTGTILISLLIGLVVAYFSTNGAW